MIELRNVTYCLGGVADAAELAEFAARTFADAFAADNNPEDLEAHLSANYGPGQQAAELADPSVRTILARSNGELVAYAQVRRNAPPPCVTHAAPVELHRFYVDSRAHGSGLASELMQAVDKAAREFEGRHIWLGVWERNPRAIAFYKKAGFIDVGNTIYMVGPDRQVDRVLVASVRPPGSDTASCR
ncbi:MAG: GNAT family N-acetyltransferase [Gammaproteobacteria bacterium]|nr:GNAT family N-acetyltransferase [Gammaproteobacteria bacterium]MBT8105769.1 GNAT family N-acetyltransferase [Gammaproteobacteria bacterium]NNF48996.1 GNAT family N-acetyltransferase [Woeseiaceae bacterium]NNK25783.1 GNAT family N-acetyltransferase [Woeseiaceae bacterium]NNL63024.1 GNAT family N-acetyltransferase [Woeseiaceae bacterium]